MTTALVCIAKNEDHYIQEWIAYNLKLGFDHIFIYANNWEFEYPHRQVSIIQYPGENKQRAAYAYFLSHYRKAFTWAAFFDVDEYLVLKKSPTIREFLQDYEDTEAVAINWVMFGDNELTEVTDDYSYLRRFTKRQKGVNEHIKCILNLTNNSSAMDVHNPYGVASTDTNWKKVTGPYNPYGDDSIAQLNHYYSRTIQEFKDKCDRGRADAHIKNDYSFHAIHNHNDIEDTLARDFLYTIH
jgi:hypothetical protein